MWVNKVLFNHMLADSKVQSDRYERAMVDVGHFSAQAETMKVQKAKDDITIDWMRHRVNALEKQNALLLGKAAGIFVPVPEIVPNRPGSMSVPDFDSMPSFDDVGDEKAKELGVTHDESGELVFTK